MENYEKLWHNAVTPHVQCCETRVKLRRVGCHGDDDVSAPTTRPRGVTAPGPLLPDWLRDWLIAWASKLMAAWMPERKEGITTVLNTGTSGWMTEWVPGWGKKEQMGRWNNG